MSQSEALGRLKEAQKMNWSHFYALERITVPPAGLLVEFSEVQPQQTVLDVACGTGVVAVTAARRGAIVSGVDFVPQLIEYAKENARVAAVKVAFSAGDVEALPYEDESFDMVLSQFGHMFAPRPEVAISEMLRVVKRGGCLAFSTWCPELFVGDFFALLSRYALPSPFKIPSPILWGDPSIVRERLGERVTNVRFDVRINQPGFLSEKHARETFEPTLVSFCSQLVAESPEKLALFRQEYESLIASYMKGNVLEQHFLMTRAIKI
jgi:SAM-dependent methyltransferase